MGGVQGASGPARWSGPDRALGFAPSRSSVSAIRWRSRAQDPDGV